MSQTVFGYPVELTEDWDDRSVYTFVLKGGNGAQSPVAAGGPMAMHGGSGGQDFRSNVVVIREAKGDRDLAGYVQEQKQKLTEKLSAAKLVNESATNVGGHPAHEQEYHISLDRPLPSLVQWHVSVDRDGCFYHFCCSSTQNEFQGTKAQFESLINSWA
jgi:hypothetical protein